jgi:hypothetical protein
MQCYNYITLSKEYSFNDFLIYSYENLTGRWFFFPIGLQYISNKPAILSFAKGFRLNGRIVKSILSTDNTFEMKETDADSILTNTLIKPTDRKCIKMLADNCKLMIVTLRTKHLKDFKFSDLLEELEMLNAAAIYIGIKVKIIYLKKICIESKIPVIVETGKDMDEILSKINAGAYAISIFSKHISTNLVNDIRSLYPQTPILAYCDRNQKDMIKSIDSGCDAVIYKPCIPYIWD